VVPRRELKDTIATLLKFAGAPYEGETAAGAAAAEGE
jgi:hypothetical protein